MDQSLPSTPIPRAPKSPSLGALLPRSTSWATYPILAKELHTAHAALPVKARLLLPSPQRKALPQNPTSKRSSPFSHSGVLTLCISHLNANPSASTRYTTWFGAYSSSRLSLVKSAMNTLRPTPSGWTYDCTCTESGTFAYVYPSQYGLVYLCGAFWTAPATGALTIELRHVDNFYESAHRSLKNAPFTFGSSMLPWCIY
ncbi:hypothetical protein FRC02_001795 [Tulasnella sp. 418]|nr:hypothetical protein FRC02_001795 [Tulasnella sp. 418]